MLTLSATNIVYRVRQWRLCQEVCQFDEEWSCVCIRDRPVDRREDTVERNSRLKQPQMLQPLQWSPLQLRWCWRDDPRTTATGPFHPLIRVLVSASNDVHGPLLINNLEASHPTMIDADEIGPLHISDKQNFTQRTFAMYHEKRDGVPCRQSWCE